MRTIYYLVLIPISLFMASTFIMYLYWPDSNQHLLGTQTAVLKPPTKEELGRATWTFLHTMASSFPAADAQEEAHKLTLITSFLNAFVQLYPCADCGAHFKTLLNSTPVPETQTRDKLEIWLCERHNDVNMRLNKSITSCQLDQIRSRWKQKKS